MKEVSCNTKEIMERDVYKRQDDDLYEKIRKTHNNMNGDPDRLIIHVYSNIDDLQKGHEVGEKEFNVKE